MRHRDRLTRPSPTPRDELAATIARAEARIPAIADRLAPLVAKTSSPRIARQFIAAEIRRLLSELAAEASEPGRRALLGLELEPRADRGARDRGLA